MKADIVNTIKLVLADRLMTIFIIIFILFCGSYSTYVALSLHPSDLQVAIHYTAYGETTFYRDKWYYFITFVVFGGVIGILHSILTAKIYAQGRRQLALLFLGASFLVMVIAWFITWSVLKVAFL